MPESSRVYASADVFVNPSTSETLRFSTLEAMSSGCPVVAADAGGLRDLVRNQDTGLTCTPGNPAEMTLAVRRLLQDRDLARWLATQARKVALESNWASQTAGLVESYRQAIRQHRQRSWVGKLMGCRPTP